MVCGEIHDSASVAVDVVLEVLDAQAIEVLLTALLPWIEWPPGSISGPVQQEMPAGSESPDVGSGEECSASGSEGPENLLEVPVVVLDVFGDLDGDGAIETIIGKWKPLVEIAAMKGDLVDLKILLREVAGGDVGKSLIQKFLAEEA